MQNIKTLKFVKSGYVLVSHFKMEHWFLLIFLLAGFTFALLVPTGWNTDESNHSYRIQQLSQGSIFSSKTIDPQTGLVEAPTFLYMD